MEEEYWYCKWQVELVIKRDSDSFRELERIAEQTDTPLDSLVEMYAEAGLLWHVMENARSFELCRMQRSGQRRPLPANKP